MWTALLTFTLSALLLTNAQEANDEPISRQLADATTSFSVDLFKEQLNEKEGNAVISPVSVSTLLAILQQGAGGNTLSQLTQVLHADAEQSRQGYSQLTRNLKADQGNETLEFANGAFLQSGYNVRTNIQNIMTNDFQSEVENVDFSQADAAAAEINFWVSEHTHNRIQNLISPDALTSDTRFVLTNAIYFKDQWETSFKTENTYNQAFYTEQNSRGTDVQMMHMTHNFPAGSLDNLDAKWVSLPFQGGRFSMLLVVPNQVNGVDNVTASMTAQDLSGLIQSVSNTSPQKVQLSMPRFKMSSTMELVQPLARLGLVDIFTGAADLSGISEEPVAVSQVIQKAEIEVDELGATASAATGIVVSLTSVHVNPELPLVITADHPFFAFIIDGMNNVPLFASRITDPAAS